MVLSNAMLLCEIHPKEVHRWFMEMYVDSSDWVMGPNVYGMGQFNDGGIFATKRYICGSKWRTPLGKDLLQKIRNELSALSRQDSFRGDSCPPLRFLLRLPFAPHSGWLVLPSERSFSHSLP